MVYMNSYYSIEQQQILRAQAYIKIAIAWFLGALTVWLWANQQEGVRNFWYVYWAFVGGIKLLGLIGWMDFSRSKGYSRFLGLLSFIPVLGIGTILMMDDRWNEQKAPKLKMRRMSW